VRLSLIAEEIKMGEVFGLFKEGHSAICRRQSIERNTPERRKAP
jgi:hypothetical protein